MYLTLKYIYGQPPDYGLSVELPTFSGNFSSQKHISFVNRFEL